MVEDLHKLERGLQSTNPDLPECFFDTVLESYQATATSTSAAAATTATSITTVDATTTAEAHNNYNNNKNNTKRSSQQQSVLERFEHVRGRIKRECIG